MSLDTMCFYLIDGGFLLASLFIKLFYPVIMLLLGLCILAASVSLFSCEGRRTSSPA